MKKIIIIAFALVVSIAASAQMKTTDYNYSSFKGISADSEFEVAEIEALYKEKEQRGLSGENDADFRYISCE